MVHNNVRKSRLLLLVHASEVNKSYTHFKPIYCVSFVLNMLKTLQYQTLNYSPEH